MTGSQPGLRAVFCEALERQTVQARAEYLDQTCEGRPELRARVEALLQAHDEAGGFLREPVDSPTLTAAGQPAAETAGTVIGPYRLLQQLGEGGMGTVFMAEQTQPVQRKVALKVIKPGMDSKQVIARFEAERQALAMMDHVNIARVLDAGTTEAGRPYFVMELVHGVPITKYCDDNHLTPRERLELFVPVCQAIQHAHQKGIIHRDVKPSNVMVTLHDGKPVPKVIDFGVAKAIDQPLTARTLFTQDGTIVGTLEYMSPEQAETSALGVDTRSDIYSLGVLLYELLTGSTPLSRQRVKEAAYVEVLRLIREEEPPKPSTRLSDSGEALASISARRHMEPAKLTRLVRGELDWIVMKALEKYRHRRYVSANDFAADVQRYLADEPVHACPPSAGYRLGKFLRRNKGPVLAAVLVLLALFGAGIGTAFGLIEGQKQREVTGLWHQAEAARRDAEMARDGEAKARWEAEVAREKLAAVEYGRTMQVAHQEWWENNVPATLTLLKSTRADLRGWEYCYVHRLCHSDLLTLGGHTGVVTAASFSPDGLRVVTGSLDGTARVWDAKSGAGLLTLEAHTGVVTAALGPDGSRVVTGGADGTAKLWDAKTGDELLALVGHSGAVTAASFGPDGLRVVTGSEDSTARVWDAKSGAELLALKGHTRVVTAASFSPDGSRLVTGGDTTARVWDAKTGAELLALKGHTRSVLSASFSADGSRLVTGSGDNTARVWDAKTGTEVLALKGHTRAVNSASFSPDGSRLVTGSLDGTTRVWDAKSGAELLAFKGHTGAVRSASFSPDGSRLVTGSADGTAKLWDAKHGVGPLALKGHTAVVWSASFSPDGSRVVTGSLDDTARVWDAKSGAEVLALKGHTRAVNSASFSPDGSRLATGSADGTTRLWDARTGVMLLAFEGHTAAVWSASFSPDGSRLVTGSADGTARLWDAKSGAELLVFEGHTDVVRSASFGPDGLRVVTGSLDNTARVWDATSGAALLVLDGHTAAVWSASFGPDGSQVVTGSLDGTAQVWDARTGAKLLALKGHAGVATASFSPDGSRIVTGDFDGTAKVWDAWTAAELLALKGHTRVVSSASFSPDGSQLVTGGDTTARVWNATPVP